MALCPNGHKRTPENTYDRSDGTHACRACKREAQRRYRDGEKRPESARPTCRKGHPKSEFATTNYRGDTECRECRRLANKRWAAKQPAGTLATMNRGYRAANPDRVKAWNKAQYERDKVKLLAKTRRRQYRRLEGAFTDDEWWECKRDFGWQCAYCRADVGDELTMDHVTSLAAGGSHDATNIVPACRSCNSSKQDKPLLVWLATGGPPAILLGGG